MLTRKPPDQLPPDEPVYDGKFMPDDGPAPSMAWQKAHVKMTAKYIDETISNAPNDFTDAVKEHVDE